MNGVFALLLWSGCATGRHPVIHLPMNDDAPGSIPGISVGYFGRPFLRRLWFALNASI